MQSFRLAHHQFIEDLTGFGAQKFGGRWNSVGVPCLYSSTHLSLAVLERMVHAQGKTDLVNLSFRSFTVADEALYRIDTARLATGWQNDVAYSQWLGDQILQEDYAGFLAPSVIIRGEWNVVLNPQAIDKIHASPAEVFTLDNRLVSLA